MKILLVEDEPTHAKLAQAVLESAGESVRHVTTAEAVLAALELDWPDAILLDLKLPGIDGLELARQLKAKAMTRPVPIVACTAYSNLFSAQTAKDAGCVAWLEKPLDTRTLAARLREAAARAA